MSQLQTLTAEKKIIETITVNSENIKDYRKLTEFIETKCNISTKKSPNRPWIYLKTGETLKTFGGIRLNKNSIGTFYIDTNPKTPLNEEVFAIASKDQGNFISNRIIVNDLQALDKVCDMICDLLEEGSLYTGKKN